MAPEWFFALLVGAVIAMLVHLYFERGMCGLRVTRGSVRAHYGVVPPAALGDVQDALRASNASGRITILGGGKFPRVEFRGSFSENEKQRVRNVLGNVPTTRFRA